MGPRSHVRLLEAPEGGRRALVHVGGSDFPIEYLCHEADLSATVDPFVVATLIPKMSVGEDLVASDPVSTRLLGGMTKIQRALVRWFPELSRIRVEAPHRAPRSYDGRGVACFFTGGVDSFHTVQENLEELDCLIYVHGFDAPVADEKLRRSITEELGKAAAEMGKPLLHISTNLRTMTNRFARWTLANGAALASVALVLAPAFRKVYLSASQNLQDLPGQGSHPLTDPLWSTEEVEIVHFGADCTRVEKLEAIAENETAMKWLRVCWKNPGGAYNCGRCEKCLRTAAILQIIGAPGRCPTLPASVGPDDISGFSYPNERYRVLIMDVVHALRERGGDAAMEKAFMQGIRRGKRREQIRNALHPVLGTRAGKKAVAIRNKRLNRVNVSARFESVPDEEDDA